MPDTSPPADPIDPSFHDVFALFEGPLAGVTFPDVDSASLDDLAEGVRRAADELTQAEALLEASRGLLHERREALLARARRALAYAQIFAADKPELAAAIGRITLPRGGSPAAHPSGHQGAPAQAGARKRGRPRKVREEDLLFSAATEAPATAAE